MKNIPSRLPGLAMAAVLAGASLLAACSSTGAAIVGARLYPAPDAAPIEDSVVLVRDGRIAAVGRRGDLAVPRGYDVVDRRGQVLVAGFWNSHIHPLTPNLVDPAARTPQAIETALSDTYARWGFTTVVDLASSTPVATDIARRILADELAAPRLLTVGDPFYPKDGTPVYARPIYEALGLPSAEVATPAEAEARVGRQADAGVRAVKLFTGAIIGGETGVVEMPADIVAAAVGAARARGLPVFAHPTNQRGLEIAVEGGVDVLAHVAPLAGPWPADFAARLAREEVALVPTLLLFEAQPHPSTPVSVGQQQVRALADAGGDILFGTDAGFMEIYDTTGEFRLMAEVLNWRQILASLTTAPARRFGEAAERGRVTPGMAADLVLLKTDPAVDPTAFSQVLETYRAGRLIYPAPVGASAEAP